MDQQQPSAEQVNVHPEDAGLEMPIVPGTEPVDAKDRMVLGYWREAIDAEFTVQGLDYNPDPSIDNVSLRFDRIKLDAVIARRRTLESNPQFRHPIPYAMIHRYNEAKNKVEFFVYQRTKKVGEEKLAGNHSIGGGGHPESQSMRFYPNHTMNAKEALLSSLVDELDEEFIFNGLTFQELVERTAITFSHEGFIRDDMNEVGKQHLGVVYSVGLPPHIDVVCREEELITCGFYTLEEIIDPASGFNLERWSYILADSLTRMAEEERAKVAEQVQSNEAIALEARAQAEALAQLPPTPLTLEKANEYQQSSGFDLLAWELAEGETLNVRGEAVFFDGLIDHPMEGKKEIIVAIDPEDPNPVATIEAIKAEVLKGWDVLKGDPVPAPEDEILDDGNGLELEQEEDGDLPDDLDDEEAGRVGDEVAEEIRTGQPYGEADGEEVHLPESVERRPDGGLNVNYGNNPEIGRGLSRPIELNPELQAQAITAHERNIQQSHSGSGDNVAGDKVYPRGGRPEFAHVDEAPFRYDPAPHRDARDDSGYGGGDSGGSSDSGSSSSD